MLGVRFPPSTAPLRQVQAVQFGLLSPEEIKAMSVVKIEIPELYTEASAGNPAKPRMGGLLDPRLGTVDRTATCLTCGQGMAECPGHFGHIELARPVFHIGMCCFLFHAI